MLNFAEEVHELDEKMNQLIWKDLRLTVKNSDSSWLLGEISQCCNWSKDSLQSLEILKGVSGYTVSGKLTAIMGPSGAGKTTLLSALARRIELTQGLVTLNGQVLSKDAISLISGYVPQFDALPSLLTVTEYTFFVCSLKRSHWTQIERKEIIEKSLIDLGLYDSRDTLISALSGGEMKRLSVTVELMTEPMILFLDEPTSGLDRFSALRVIECLKFISSKGAIVLCTIHQPGMMLYQLFDRVVWLADGKTAYFGSLDQATKFFSSQGYICPEGFDESEFYVKILSSQDVDKAADRISRAFSTSSLSVIPNYYPNACRTLDFTIPRKSSCIIQFRWLLWRMHLQNRRELFSDWIGWLSYLLSLLAVGLVFGRIDSQIQEGVQNARGALYMTNSEIFFTVAYSVIYEFPRDFCTYVREAGLYSSGPYYVTTFLFLLPKVILKAWLFTIVLYLMLNNVEHSIFSFFYYCLCTSIAAICGSSYGIMFSSWILDVELATTIMVPIDMAFLLTAGVFYNLRSLPKYLMYLKYGSIFFYSNEALSILYWSPISKIECYATNNNLPCLQNGEQVLAEYGFTQSNFWWDLFGMILLTIIMSFVGYLGVRQRRLTMARF